MSTPEDRSAVASIAANTRWGSETNRAGATAEARRNSPASLEYWLKDIDPRLPREQRIRIAESRKKAYYQRLMRKARAAKAGKAASKRKSGAA